VTPQGIWKTGSQELLVERQEKATAPPTELIVLIAFDKGEDGELLPAFEAREMQDEQRPSARPRIRRTVMWV
jgi:hypothetical protein